MISFFAASEQFEGLRTTELDKGAARFDDFEHKKKFLDPSLINFSSAFKPARSHVLPQFFIQTMSMIPNKRTKI